MAMPLILSCGDYQDIIKEIYADAISLDGNKRDLFVGKKDHYVMVTNDSYMTINDAAKCYLIAFLPKDDL